MPHFSVRYTRRAAVTPPIPPDGGSVDVTVNFPLPQIREIVCAENEAHARAMLGMADPNLPVFVSKTRSPVTLNRFCACQRIA